MTTKQAPGAPALPPPLAGKAFYRIDAGPQTPCTAGSPCEARIVLTALAGYKVNKDYPFKFLAEPVSGVTVDGTGTFAFDDVKTGTLTLRFRAAKPGPARFSGTFKLSVCTAEQCEIEEPKVELSIPVDPLTPSSPPPPNVTAGRDQLTWLSVARGSATRHVARAHRRLDIQRWRVSLTGSTAAAVIRSSLWRSHASVAGAALSAPSTGSCVASGDSCKFVKRLARLEMCPCRGSMGCRPGGMGCRRGGMGYRPRRHGMSPRRHGMAPRSAWGIAAAAWDGTTVSMGYRRGGMGCRRGSIGMAPRSAWDIAVAAWDVAAAAWDGTAVSMGYRRGGMGCRRGGMGCRRGGMGCRRGGMGCHRLCLRNQRCLRIDLDASKLRGLTVAVFQRGPVTDAITTARVSTSVPVYGTLWRWQPIPLTSA